MLLVVHDGVDQFARGGVALKSCEGADRRIDFHGFPSAPFGAVEGRALSRGFGVEDGVNAEESPVH